MHYGDKEIFESLVGKTINKIYGMNKESKQISLLTDKEEYILFHSTMCCEQVYVEDVIGDVEDLIGSPITLAEVVTKEGDGEYSSTLLTWTFYKLATIKGYVTIRWLGESGVEYSREVSVRVENIEEDDDYEYHY